MDMVVHIGAHMRPVDVHVCDVLPSTGHDQVVMTLNVRIPDNRKIWETVKKYTFRTTARQFNPWCHPLLKSALFSFSAPV